MSTRERPRWVTEGAGGDGERPTVMVAHDPDISGVLLIDVSESVEHAGILEAREVWKALPGDLPRGAPIRLLIGDARVLTGELDGAAATLRRAGSIEVVGTDSAGIRTVRSSLLRALRFAAEAS